MAVAKGECDDIISTHQKIFDLEDEINRHHEVIDIIEAAIAHQVSTDPTIEEEIYKAFKPQLEHNQEQILEKVVFSISGARTSTNKILKIEIQNMFGLRLLFSALFSYFSNQRSENT